MAYCSTMHSCLSPYSHPSEKCDHIAASHYNPSITLMIHIEPLWEEFANDRFINIWISGVQENGNYVTEFS